MLEVQADGKIVAGINTSCPGGSCISIFRFNPNGSADTTFGVAGRAGLPYSVYGIFEIYGIALQPDGKILATARAMNASQTKLLGALVRLNVDGSVDQAFGVSGIVKNEMPYDVYPTSITLQPDGKILSGGYVVNNSVPSATRFLWAVARNNADGSLDTTFAQNGILMVDPTNSGHSILNSILVQPDGKIVLAGECISGVFASARDLTIMRYDPSGVPDTSFGDGGIASTNIHPAIEILKDAVLRPDGKILLAGIRGGSVCCSLLLAQFDETGQLDSSFGSAGFAEFAGRITNGNAPGSVALLPDGKILVGGAGLNSQADFAVGRFTEDGTLDSGRFAFGRQAKVMGSSWGINGTAIAFGTGGWDHSMAVDAAGRVLVSGRTSSTGTLTLARFQGDAAPYASVSGTVRTAGGLPIRNAYVTLSGGSLSEPATVLTNNLGIYQFTNLPVTETYNVTATAKRFRFATGERTVMLNTDTENFDFNANQ